MTIPEALKELYVALGGDADDVADMSTNPELIAKIATIAGGGSGLPEVTAADNGDILAVINGAWGKKEAMSHTLIRCIGGGGSKFNIPDGMTTGDLYARFEAGENLVIDAGLNDSSYCRYYVYDCAGDRAVFVTHEKGSSGVLHRYFTLTKGTTDTFIDTFS